MKNSFQNLRQLTKTKEITIYVLDAESSHLYVSNDENYGKYLISTIKSEHVNNSAQTTDYLYSFTEFDVNQVEAEDLTTAILQVTKHMEKSNYELSNYGDTVGSNKFQKFYFEFLEYTDKKYIESVQKRLLFDQQKIVRNGDLSENDLLQQKPLTDFQCIYNAKNSQLYIGNGDYYDVYDLYITSYKQQAVFTKKEQVKYEHYVFDCQDGLNADDSNKSQSLQNSYSKTADLSQSIQQSHLKQKTTHVHQFAKQEVFLQFMKQISQQLRVTNKKCNGSKIVGNSLLNNFYYEKTVQISAKSLNSIETNYLKFYEEMERFQHNLQLNFETYIYFFSTIISQLTKFTISRDFKRFSTQLSILQSDQQFMDIIQQNKQITTQDDRLQDLLKNTQHFRSIQLLELISLNLFRIKLQQLQQICQVLTKDTVRVPSPIIAEHRALSSARRRKNFKLREPKQNENVKSSQQYKMQFSLLSVQINQFLKDFTQWESFAKQNIIDQDQRRNYAQNFVLYTYNICVTNQDAKKMDQLQMQAVPRYIQGIQLIDLSAFIVNLLKAYLQMQNQQKNTNLVNLLQKITNQSPVTIFEYCDMFKLLFQAYLVNHEKGLLGLLVAEDPGQIFQVLDLEFQISQLQSSTEPQKSIAKQLLIKEINSMFGTFSVNNTLQVIQNNYYLRQIGEFQQFISNQDDDNLIQVFCKADQLYQNFRFMIGVYGYQTEQLVEQAQSNICWLGYDDKQKMILQIKQIAMEQLGCNCFNDVLTKISIKYQQNWKEIPNVYFYIQIYNLLLKQKE